MALSQQAFDKLSKHIFLVTILAKWHFLTWRRDPAAGLTTLSEYLADSPDAARQASPIFHAEARQITPQLSSIRLQDYIQGRQTFRKIFPENSTDRPSGKTTPGAVLSIVASAAVAILLINVWNGQHADLIPGFARPAVRVFRNHGGLVLWSLPLLLLACLGRLRIWFHNRNRLIEHIALSLPVVHLLVVTGASALSAPEVSPVGILFLASSWVGSILALRAVLADEPSPYCEAAGVFLQDMAVLSFDIGWLPNAHRIIEEGHLDRLKHLPEPQTSGTIGYVVIHTHPDAVEGRLVLGVGTRYVSEGYQRDDMWSVLGRSLPTATVLSLSLTMRLDLSLPSEEVEQIHRQLDDAVSHHPVEAPASSPAQRLLQFAWLQRERLKAEPDQARIRTVIQRMLERDRAQLPDDHLQVITSTTRCALWLAPAPERAAEMIALTATYFPVEGDVEAHSKRSEAFLVLLRHLRAQAFWRLEDDEQARHHLSILLQSAYCTESPEQRQTISMMRGWVALFSREPAEAFFAEPFPVSEEPSAIERMFIQGRQLAACVDREAIAAASVALSDLADSAEPPVRFSGQIIQRRLQELSEALD